MLKIYRNRIRCRHRGDEIQSNHRHDFKSCKCGKVAVDGGKDYLRRQGSSKDFVELTLFEVVEEDVVEG